MKPLLALLFLLAPISRTLAAGSPFSKRESSREHGAQTIRILVVQNATPPGGSRVFYNAVMRKAGVGYAVEITHSTGTALNPITEKTRLQAWELSAAQQRTFGFDPAAVADDRARQMAAAAKINSPQKMPNPEVEMLKLQLAQRRAAIAAQAGMTPEQKADADAAYHRAVRQTQRNAGFDPDKIARTAGQRLLMASPEEQLRAAGLANYFRTLGPMPLEQLALLSQEDKLALLLLQ